jgi:tetratricopeptide (TPR) repeat protein
MNPGMYRLVFLSGRYQGKRLVVRQAVTWVGRAAECHLLLPDDPLLAPRHACFEERGTGGVFLSSLAPEHPVSRNGEPVVDAVRLTHNDLLVLGETQVQFQDIIAPHQRLRPSPGLMQPVSLLVATAIIALELGLLILLVNWPQRLIRPETEAADLAFAEKMRAPSGSATNGTTGTVAAVVAKAPVSVVTLPGTTPAASSIAPPATTNADGTLPPPPVAATSTAPAAILQVLDQADFAPADTNSAAIDLPAPAAAPDPAIEQAQRMLSEAVSAAQFADYGKATRLLNQIHQTAPGFLPAHVEHARLLEARGDLDAAYRRWTQIMGLAPKNSSSYAQAIEERQRLARIQTLQTQILQTPETQNLATLPRHVRFLNPDIQKMPADGDVAEMRVLSATLELAPEAHLFKDAVIQIFITFYDLDANNVPQVTRAIATPSPIVLGHTFADRRSVPLNATYVVPRSFRTEGRPSAYYGYTLHVFAGQILQDAVAKPKKLLDRPLHFPTAASDPEP